MHNSMKRAITAITLGVALVSTISAKDANAFIDLNLTSTALSGSNTVFTYTLSLNPGFNVDANSSLTLFDFNGLIGTPIFTPTAGNQPNAAIPFPTFTVTTPATGTNVALGGSVDSPLVFNIDLNSDGAITGNAQNTSAIVIGTLQATSQFPQFGVGTVNPFTATTQNQGGGVATSGSSIQGPGTTVVPEAGTMGLLATGLLGMVGVVLRRRTAK